jgi:hypothetical protein
MKTAGLSGEEGLEFRRSGAKMMRRDGRGAGEGGGPKAGAEPIAGEVEKW